MNILQLEQERTTLKEKLTAQYSPQTRLLFLFSFFDKVLSTGDKNLIDAFLPEFISEYVFCLKNYTVLGMKPRTCLAGRQVHELLIEQAEKIEKNGFVAGHNGFVEIIQKLKDEFEKLQRILRGEHIETNESKAYFPLLEEEAIKETNFTIGVIESVTIKISKTKHSNKFIIVPSEKEIEEKINEQVKLSWMNAINIADRYIRKIHPYHEVIISFDKKAGFCKGNSLGTALTLAFIEEIFRTYNSPLSIKVGDGIAFTGGMDEQGRITNTSEEIIKQKTELIFFSELNLFVVPKEEETAAIEKLNELKEEFPQRDLKVLGVEDIIDLLDRRTIVEIKKQPVIVRSGKFLAKNWAALSTIVILTAIISFYLIRDNDTNPVALTADGSKIYLKNKSGKVLLEKDVSMPKQLVDSPIFLMSVAKVVDINNDGVNEVIICKEQKKYSGDSVDNSAVRCYNYKGEIIWQFSFADKILLSGGEQNTDYGIGLLDTLTLNGEKSLFLISSNINSFSSAIYRLDIKNGKRLPGTFWSSGHVINGIIKDIDNDDAAEILAVGYDNGFEDVVFFAYEVDTLTKVRPTTENYLIRNFPLSEMKAYIRFPKTDYDIYYAVRTPLILTVDFWDDEKRKRYHFSVANVRNSSDASLSYKISYDFTDIDVIVDSDFRVQRDTLVAQGELKPPYTDTNEYVALVKSKILYLQDGKWVRREELE